MSCFCCVFYVLVPKQRLRRFGFQLPNARGRLPEAWLKSDPRRPKTTSLGSLAGFGLNRLLRIGSLTGVGLNRRLRFPANSRPNSVMDFLGLVLSPVLV